MNDQLYIINFVIKQMMDIEDKSFNAIFEMLKKCFPMATRSGP